MLTERPIEVKGDGTPRRSYLYAADLAIWLWTILFRAPDLIPINVGSANDVSILELAQLVAALLNTKAEIRVAKNPVPGVQPLRYVPSVDRARHLLGLEERIPLEESIRRTAAWHHEQRIGKIAYAMLSEIDAFFLRHQWPFQHERVNGAHVFADDAQGYQLYRAQEEEAQHDGRHANSEVPPKYQLVDKVEHAREEADQGRDESRENYQAEGAPWRGW